MTAVKPQLLSPEEFRQQQAQAVNAAKFGELRAVTQAEIDDARYRYLAPQGRLNAEDRQFVEDYRITHDPFAFRNAAIDAAAAFAGGYTPKGTPLSARQPVVPGRGPNATRPPKVHGNSFEYVGETHVYAIRGPGGTHKIGESMQGTRKSDSASIRGEAQARALTRETGLLYKSEIIAKFLDKQSTVEYQTRFIDTFHKLYGDSSLPGNKTNR